MALWANEANIVIVVIEITILTYTSVVCKVLCCTEVRPGA